jgi:hypothetical protein
VTDNPIYSIVGLNRIQCGNGTARKRGQKPYSKLERLGHQIPEGQRQALHLLCIAHRVRLLVHGHLHLTEDRRLGGVRIIGSPATTEPVSKRKQNNDYQFCMYSVLGDGGRIRFDQHIVSNR